MVATTGFHGITLHSQRDTPSADVANQVMALWARNAVLPPNVAPQDRVRQVVLAALAPDGTAIGVTTAYPGTLPQADAAAAPEPCYFYRMFIEPAHRRPHLMRIMTTTAYDVLRRHRPATGPACLAIITDNMGLTGAGMLRLFERHGYSVRGQLRTGALLIVKPF